MQIKGLSQDAARSRVSMFDIDGLLEPSRADLPQAQNVYAHKAQASKNFVQTIETLKPTILIGVSTKGGAFNQHVVETMSTNVLTRDAPFASLGAERRAALIREQSIIAEFEKDLAIDTLPALLSEPEARRKAIEVVEFIAGSLEEMEPHTLKTLQRFHAVLGLPAIASTLVTSDPLPENSDNKEAA